MLQVWHECKFSTLQSLATQVDKLFKKSLKGMGWGWIAFFPYGTILNPSLFVDVEQHKH